MRRWNLIFSWAIAVVASTGHVLGTTVFRDAETGFTFSEYSAAYDLSHSIVFRIAVPSTATDDEGFDAVIQVVAPISVGWTGLAWGGRMTGCPLSVSWSSGSGVVVSSRHASDHQSTPPVYSGATYQVFKTGTHVNRTHWQYTAKCTGCTSWTSSWGGTNVLNPSGGNQLAFAYAASRPSNPSSSSSSFNIHDVTGSWIHDFSSGRNAAFSSLVATNAGH